jgi:hypothetical protein
MTEELKPCPFCGEYLDEIKGPDTSVHLHKMDTHCIIGSITVVGEFQKTFWNTRAPLPKVVLSPFEKFAMEWFVEERLVLENSASSVYGLLLADVVRRLMAANGK